MGTAATPISDCPNCGGARYQGLTHFCETTAVRDPGLPLTTGEVRQSISPTYDHRETGDRFTVETLINGRRLNEITVRDPFVHHRVVIGWRDLARFILGGRDVKVVVGGDPQIVDDVLELDADCLTFHSTRRAEFNAQVEEALRRG